MRIIFIFILKVWPNREGLNPGFRSPNFLSLLENEDPGSRSRHVTMLYYVPKGVFLAPPCDPLLHPWPLKMTSLKEYIMITNSRRTIMESTIYKSISLMIIIPNFPLIKTILQFRCLISDTELGRILYVTRNCCLQLTNTNCTFSPDIWLQ